MFPDELTDRGVAWAKLAWDRGRLVRLDVAGAVVHGAVVQDPLLGDAHAIEVGDARTTMTALDWARPAQIPAIAHPGRLGGAGAAILNAIARLAEHAGVTALRYAGPYPTPALWRSLARSFRCDATEAEFTGDLVPRMATRARTEIAIDFHPASHARIAIGESGHTASRGDAGSAIARGVVELRDGIERVVLDRVSYEPAGSPARLVDGCRAEIWFGDSCYARIATFAGDGSLVDGPHAIPACPSAVIDKPFPPALVAALAELVGDAVPAPLADAARRFLVERPVRWADLGARAARVAGDAVLVHAAIWERVAPHGMARLALAIAEALAPVVTIAVLATTADATVPG